MFKRLMIILAVLTASLAATRLAGPDAEAAADPTQQDLQAKLLTAQDLTAVTNAQWEALPVRAENTGPAGQADGTGCAELDSAVLSHNGGLVNSGAQDFVAPSGDFIEQTIAFDRSAADHVRELATAIGHCPQLSFSDGPKVTVQPTALGEGTAGFRGLIDGVSRSVVLTGVHGDYVVELVASDHGQSDAHYRALLERAFSRLG
jgi:hypothetical protein